MLAFTLAIYLLLTLLILTLLIQALLTIHILKYNYANVITVGLLTMLFIYYR